MTKGSQISVVRSEIKKIRSLGTWKQLDILKTCSPSVQRCPGRSPSLGTSGSRKPAGCDTVSRTVASASFRSHIPVCATVSCTFPAGKDPEHYRDWSYQKEFFIAPHCFSASINESLQKNKMKRIYCINKVGRQRLPSSQAL